MIKCEYKVTLIEKTIRIANKYLLYTYMIHTCVRPSHDLEHNLLYMKNIILFIVNNIFSYNK